MLLLLRDKKVEYSGFLQRQYSIMVKNLGLEFTDKPGL